MIEALLRPEAWPHPVSGLKLIETHISWVLLTGEYAYKIKKPVNFGFLDFSSLGKRLDCCREEVRLNRRLAPDIYLDVVSLCGSPLRPQVGGSGEVFEYAVRMRQFDVEQGFDRLLQAGALTLEHMDQTAAMLAQFHSSVESASADSGYGTPSAVLAPVQENFLQIDAYLQSLDVDSPLHAQVAHLEHWSSSTFRELQSVISDRLRQGFVRECHGDLHLRNILARNGQVIPFDCIEFNAGLRWIDVISELAFLLMDLDDHGCEHLSRRLLNAWLEHSGDYEGLQMLRFYKVYRAMVRAKVAGLRALQSSIGRVELEREFHNYVSLAETYTRRQPPRVLITHGLSGSGKTWFTQQLLQQAPLIRLRSDVERKRLFGVSQTDRSGAKTHMYDPTASEQTYDRLLGLASQLLAWGYSVLVDAAFLKSWQRQKFQNLALQLRLPFAILHCTVPEELQRQRLTARQSVNVDASDADLAVLEQQLQALEPLAETELSHRLAVDTADTGSIPAVLEWCRS
jgi:aminoglycoside phosphotransferase family enzyme